jgi:hypothetical protein
MGLVIAGYAVRTESACNYAYGPRLDYLCCVETRLEIQL